MGQLPSLCPVYLLFSFSSALEVHTPWAPVPYAWDIHTSRSLTISTVWNIHALEYKKDNLYRYTSHKPTMCIYLYCMSCPLSYQATYPPCPTWDTLFQREQLAILLSLPSCKLLRERYSSHHCDQLKIYYYYDVFLIFTFSLCRFQK